GELVDEEPLRGGLHPGAEQRDHLAEEPEPVVAVPEGGEGLAQAAAWRLRGVPRHLGGLVGGCHSLVLSGQSGDRPPSYHCPNGLCASPTNDRYPIHPLRVACTPVPVVRASSPAACARRSAEGGTHPLPAAAPR